MPVFLSKQQIADLLVTAWEGGSNYWIELAEYVYPPKMSKRELRQAAWDAASPEERDLWRSEGPGGRWPLYALLPFLPPSVKWKIKLTTNEPDMEPVFVTPQALKEAAAKMAEEFPSIYAGIKSDNYDAGDADAWLQMAAFGKIIFG